MSEAIAVIGAQFGDEGKGLATDFFVRQLSTCSDDVLVARCNGGPQAGHTVVDSLTKKRFVFGSLSAGSMAGADTYISSRAIFNPIAFDKERSKYRALKLSLPRVYVHPRARVTTPFDVALNQLSELYRDNRHGSCGMGINETVTRHEAGYRLTFSELSTTSAFEVEAILDKIAGEWVRPRLLEISEGKVETAETERLRLLIAEMAGSTLLMAQSMIESSYCINRHNPDASKVVIEGAQGLMLDEFLGTFPHVTRSVTGVASSIVAAAELNQTSIQPVYVTRAYTTRHGNGPLFHEGVQITDVQLPPDLTNQPNDWQGTFRYAPLDLTQLFSYILEDVERGYYVAQAHGIKIKKPTLFVTCLDQLGETVNVVIDGKLVKLKTADLIATLRKQAAKRFIDVSFSSHGPTAADVKELA